MPRLKILRWSLVALCLVAGVNYAQSNWQYVSADTLRNWIRDGKDLEIIDVRGKSEFQSGTIDGAINAGVDPKGYLSDNHSDPIILIAPYPFDSSVIQQWITRLQKHADQVSVLTGGIDAWIAQGGTLVEPESYYTRPGTVPFLIPKGLCEDGEPAQVFE